MTADRPRNGLHGTPLPSRDPVQGRAWHFGATSKPSSLLRFSEAERGRPGNPAPVEMDAVPACAIAH